MELKDILALRLRALMDQRPDLDTQIKIHKRTGLSQSTVQRILAREVHTALDVVERLAEAFRVKPIDLIKPIEHDDETKSIAPSYDELQLILAWRKLTEEDKHRAMTYMSVAAEVKPKRQNAGARQVKVDSEHPVPAHLSAAVKNESGAKLGDRQGIKAEKGHEKQTTKSEEKRTGTRSE